MNATGLSDRPRARRAWIAAAGLAIGLLAGSTAPEAAAHVIEIDALPVVTAEPTISITGATPEHRVVILHAVDRYLSAGLILPDLDVRVHDGKAGCGGKQGLFHPLGDSAVIDLCYPGEFLALHELGHAWEHFNLDDRERTEFQRLTGATSWTSSDVAWRRRGIEQAANTLAHGLLSTPLATAGSHATDFARFKALTGVESPRLAELVAADNTLPAVSAEHVRRLEAYAEWRNGGDPET